MRRAAVVLAAALVAASPAVTPPSAGASVSACRVEPLAGFAGGRQIVAVAGFYKGPADAIEVSLSCGVVVGGATWGSVPDKVPGPVAALAGTVDAPAGTVTSCYRLTIRYLDGSATNAETCP